MLIASRELREAVEAISVEIRSAGVPANPLLPRLVERAYNILSVGGSLVGWYGAGKTLVSCLIVSALRAAGEKAIVIGAERTLSKRGESVALAALSECNSLLASGGESLVTVAKWAASVIGVNARNRLECSDLDRKVNVARGSGFKPLIDLLVELAARGYSLIIVDEFERILVSPRFYTGLDTEGLVEEFFMLADSKPPRVGLALPSRIWLRLDLETTSRLQPVLNFAAETKPKEMREFLVNLLVAHGHGSLAGEARRTLDEYGVSLRNPRVVVTYAAEAVVLGSLERDFLIRLDALTRIAMLLPRRRLQSRLLAAVVYAALWRKQDIYAMLEETDLAHAARLLLAKGVVERVGGASAASMLHDLLEGESLARIARRKGLLSRLGDYYIASDKLVEHLRYVLRRYKEMLGEWLGPLSTPDTLMLELQLW